MVSFSLSISIARRPSASSSTNSQAPSKKSRLSIETHFVPPSGRHSYSPSIRPSKDSYRRVDAEQSANTRPRRGSGCAPVDPTIRPEDWGSSENLLGNVNTDARRVKFGNSKAKMVDIGHKDFQTSIDPDRRKSYGIGGAGNIRRPSEIIYPPRVNNDGTRRRSSVFSGMTTSSPNTSPDGKKKWSWFGRRNSSAGDEAVKFDEVDLSGDVHHQ